MDQQSSSFESFRRHVLNQGASLVVRLDLNVPMSEGQVLDTTRIRMALETLRLFKNHRLVLLTHWGRPKGFDKKSRVAFLAPILAEGLGREVALAKTPQDVVPSNSVTLLENIRFFEGETKNDARWSQELAKLGDVFINEAFSASHRAHASIVGIPSVLPSYMGPLFEAEWNALQILRSRLQEGGAVAVIAGSKVSTKIGVLRNLLQWCQHVLIGGGMGNTFLAARGFDMAHSFVEKDGLEMAHQLLDNWSHKIVLPIDGVETEDHRVTSTPHKAWGDIGPQTCQLWCQYLSTACTVFWNGPVGIYESPPLDQGCRFVAHFLDQHNRQPHVYSVVGGGDTLAVAGSAHFSYKSPSGGAFLEALEIGSLPGVDALQKN